MVRLRIENTLEKEENGGIQHFLLLSQCFKEASSSGLLKHGIIWLTYHSMTKF